MTKEFRSKGGILEKFAEWDRNTLFCRGSYAKGRKNSDAIIYVGLSLNEYNNIIKQREKEK